MPMNLKSRAVILLTRLLAPLGFRLIKIKADRIRNVDPTLDLKYLIGAVVRPVIFDVGANDGETVSEFLKVFPSAQIVAFEPFAGCQEKLVAQFGNCANVRLEKAALGAETGRSQLNVYSGSNMNSLLPMSESSDNVLKGSFEKVGITDVVLDTLDNYCAVNRIPSIEVLKIDTQGFDLNVLRGAEGLLKARRIKVILIEINFVSMYQGQAPFTEIHNFLNNSGYRLVNFYNSARPKDYIAWCDACYIAVDGN